jgi:MFS family permease
MGNARRGQLAVCDRRRARRLAYVNGGVWATGNGLTSSMLVIYLALEYDAPGLGLGIGLILAAPQLAGLLRLAAPTLIQRLGSRKRFCLVAYLLSGLVLLGLPVAASPGVLPSAGDSLAALVLLWCVYHLLEYLGTVALWSWLADLVPQRIRGRFLGRRERWMMAGQAAAMLAAGLFSYWWDRTQPPSSRWIGYAIPAGLGACLMIAALVPLAGIPDVRSREAARRATLRALAAPFCDARFVRLVLFGCWFSFFNGVTQSPQNIYPPRVLGIGLFFMLSMKVGMRIGQLGISPAMGRLADRVGNRPVMLASLPLVALGPLFYFFSGPGQPDWVARTLVAAAWASWIAYAGLNVCLPNLMLKLSPRESNTPYIAAFYSVSGLMVAAGAILGGTLLDRFGQWQFALPGGPTVDFYHFSFLFGWLTRTLGVLVLWMVIEEGPARRRKAAAVERPGVNEAVRR